MTTYKEINQQVIHPKSKDIIVDISGKKWQCCTTHVKEKKGVWVHTMPEAAEPLHNTIPVNQVAYWNNTPVRWDYHCGGFVKIMETDIIYQIAKELTDDYEKLFKLPQLFIANLPMIVVLSKGQRSHLRRLIEFYAEEHMLNIHEAVIKAIAMSMAPEYNQRIDEMKKKMISFLNL